MAEPLRRSFLPFFAACCLVGVAAAFYGNAWSYFGEGGFEDNCSNSSDDDFDGTADCQDSECFGASGACTTETSGNASCSDGFDNDADGSTDCSDGDCSGYCLPPSESGLCFNGSDDDGDASTDCADSDCEGASGSTSFSSETSYSYPYCSGGSQQTNYGSSSSYCSDIYDNEGDSYTDCNDSDCSSYCLPPSETSCTNMVDDDGDTYTDCVDSDCSSQPNCNESGSYCFNATDDDGDGSTDCMDSGCDGASTSCSYSSETYCSYTYCSGGSSQSGSGSGSCSNGVDEDIDGSTDCADSDCAGSCLPPNETSCTNTIDDDGDSNTDCADSDCSYHYTCGGSETSSGGTCADGVDSDADGQTDGADSDCAEGDGGYGCTDGTDNDSDGSVDGADSGCAEGQNGYGCTDGVDSDADGQTDGADSGCPEGSNGYGCADTIDSDGDSQADCADSGCNGAVVNSYTIEDGACTSTCSGGSAQTVCNESNPTGCANGADDDSDGQTDGADSDCAEGQNGYGCEDSQDNDSDGRTDCADSGCFGIGLCTSETAYGGSCSDGFDNDADGSIDGIDSDCPEGSGGLGCSNSTDDDSDGNPDGLDSGCQEGDGGLGCADTVDNDVDGQTDCADSSCSGALVCDAVAPTLTAFFSESASGTYIAGQTVSVFARFSEVIDPSSSMSVALDTGATVSLTATSGPSTLLSGTYTVLANQTSSELTVSSVSSSAVEDLNANAYVYGSLPGTNIESSRAIVIAALESSACADGLDNDNDGDEDCLDSQCDGVGSCEYGAESSCADSTDNDADGLADCADSDCAALSVCGGTETGAECGNISDDDSDGLADCADSDCAYLASCGGTESSCADAADNDGDGLVDCADSNCASGDTCGASSRQSSGHRSRQSGGATASSLPAAVDLNGNGVIEPALGEVVTAQNVEALFGFAGGEEAVANPSLAASLGCDPYLTATLGRGRLNPPAQVSRLQSILRALVSFGLPVTGLFDEATESAVKAFQLEHEEAILMPWGEELCPGGECRPTGVVGLTTRRFINRLVCGF